MKADEEILAWMREHAHECAVRGTVQSGELAEYAWTEVGSTADERVVESIQMESDGRWEALPARYVRLARQVAQGA